MSQPQSFKVAKIQLPMNAKSTVPAPRIDIIGGLLFAFVAAILCIGHGAAWLFTKVRYDLIIYPPVSFYRGLRYFLRAPLPCSCFLLTSLFGGVTLYWGITGHRAHVDPLIISLMYFFYACFGAANFMVTLWFKQNLMPKELWGRMLEKGIPGH